MTNREAMSETSSRRPNPFEDEPLVDERHFEPSLVDTLTPEVTTTTSPTKNTPRVPTTSAAHMGVSDWELGISPNSSAAMGLSRQEQLQLAIQTCKEMITSNTEKPERNRKLVEKLIQLRLQLQELQDGPLEINDEERRISGHEFIEQERRGRNAYCERCMGIVWRLVQPWHRCKRCGYRAHAKCLNRVTRTCAASIAKERPTYIMKICPQIGLSGQKYRCAECRTKLAFDQGAEKEPRLCDYTGQYFCSSCHWNDTMVIPARVVANWDFAPRPVSRSSKQLLEILSRKPIIKLELLNPSLLKYVEELRLIKKLRQDILLMKCYFVCCRRARKQRILWNLSRHQHFVEGIDHYSLNDLMLVVDGSLEAELLAVINTFTAHIKEECVSCQGNGYICEICRSDEILFPFDQQIATCAMCCATYHRKCYDDASKSCPRCQRRIERQLQMNAEDDGKSPVKSS